MSTASDNDKWRQKLQGSIGEVEILVPPTRNSGLRKPYQFELTQQQMDELVSQLREEFDRVPKGRLQYGYVDFKPVKYGIRLDLFALGYRRGDQNTGITAREWRRLTGALRIIVKSMLGDDAAVYIEPFSSERKFQARFETYILRK